MADDTPTRADNAAPSSDSPLLAVLRLNMMQQQAYHRLLGTVFVHHKDCPSCRPQMEAILNMIAQNIEHLDSLLPMQERSRIPGDTDDQS